MSDEDPIQILRGRAKKNAKAALDLAEKANVENHNEHLERKPEFTENAIVAVAEKMGVPVSEAEKVAADVIAAGAPAMKIESFRAENELRGEFLRLYQREIAMMKICPVKIAGVKGGYKKCGQKLDSIAEALVHHTMHLMYQADFRTQRAVVNDISEKLYPTDYKGVSAILGPEERAQMAKNPAFAARMLKRGDD